MQRHLRFRRFGISHASVLMGFMMLAVFVRVASATPVETVADCSILSLLIG